MDNAEQDLLKPESVPEGEDAAASIKDTISDEEQEILRKELEKVENEIETLSQVLAAKERYLAELKRKLGVTPLAELKQNISKGLQDVASTNVYRKTSETLSHAGQKASAAFSTVGSVITKKLEDVKADESPGFATVFNGTASEEGDLEALYVNEGKFSLKVKVQDQTSQSSLESAERPSPKKHTKGNSPTFKSFEEKVENLKSKVGGTKQSAGDFEEVLNSAANASATEDLTEKDEESH